MIDDLRAIAIFAEAIKQGSFRAAAKALTLSPSAVSYNISELEKRLGTALIYRTTRKLSLTTQGEHLFRHATAMLMAAETGLNEVLPSSGELRGTLNISITSALVSSELNVHIAAFSKLHPAMSFKINYTDVQEDLVDNGIDLAFRAGELLDSSLKSKRIGHIARTLTCSADYLTGRKTPVAPSELADWDWLALEMMADFRTLLDKNKRAVQVRGKSHIVVNSVVAMTQLCICGLGVATPPTAMVESELQKGVLVEVLPDWSVTSIPYYAVWPGNKVANANVAHFLQFLADKVGLL